MIHNEPTASSRRGYPAFASTRQSLISEGWVTPDTYSNCFAPITAIPAVYLLARFAHRSLDHAVIAYVGMSTDLSNRLANHEILKLLQSPDHWVQRWFKPTHQADLRTVEADLIRRFDPPWNIIGRPRGGGFYHDQQPQG